MTKYSILAAICLLTVLSCSFMGTQLGKSSPPGVPTGLSITDTAVNSISLVWNTQDDADSFDIYSALTSDGTYDYIATTTGNSVTVNGLNASTTYYFKVCAENSSGESGLSNYVTDTTDDAVVPGVPTGLTIIGTGVNSISLVWDAQDDADSFDIYTALSSDGTYNYAATAAGNSATVNGLNPSTTYYFKVSAENTVGESGLSNYVTDTTDDEVLPGVPTGLAVSGTGTNSISLSWDYQGDAENYLIYQSSASTGTYTQVSTSLGTGATIGSLLPSTTYFFKIAASNTVGESAQSDYVNGTTLDAAALPEVPTGLSVSATSSNSVSLSWDFQGDADEYLVYRSLSSGGTYILVATESGTSAVISGLLSSTSYFFRIAASNAAGDSDQSDYVEATTDASTGGGSINSSGILINHLTRDITALSQSSVSDAISDLVVVYKHSSHGSQLLTGMNALEAYPADDFDAQGSLNWFNAAYGGSEANSLEIRDLAWNDGGSSPTIADLSYTDYGGGVDSVDGNGDTPWVIWTRNYLAANPTVNTVMWSWCSIRSHDVQLYLDNMEKLISEYEDVAFVFMTGHAEGDGEQTAVNSIHYNNQAIRAHCAANNRILYDFADIEAYDPDGTYYWDQNMQDHLEYGSSGNNWAVEWLAANDGSLLDKLTTGQGVDGYNGLTGTAHSPDPGEPEESNLNGVLKGIAAWHLWTQISARID